MFSHSLKAPAKNLRYGKLIIGWSFCALLLVWVAPLLENLPATTNVPAVAQRISSNPDPNSKAEKINYQARESLGKLPLSFEKNVGQSAEQVKFLVRNNIYNLFLTENEAVMAFSGQTNQTEPNAIRMRWAGGQANPSVRGLDELPSRTSYLQGSDQTNWRSNVSNYGRVEYQEIYPGINLVFHSVAQQLEYDFVVKPGANPEQIRLTFEGATNISLSESGALELHTPAGKLVHQAPTIYQLVNNQKTPLVGAYQLISGGNGLPQVGFSLAGYNPAHTLVIDPLISSTYIGGGNIDQIQDMAVTSNGEVYVTGLTYSTDFPTVAPITTKKPGIDIFVSKLSADGTSLVFSAYLGGSGDDIPYALALGDTQLYITGFTASTDLATIGSNYQNSYGGGVSDGFLMVLPLGGSSLIYQSYIGGSGQDIITDVAWDSGGKTYLTGSTTSGNLNIGGSFSNANSGGGDAFVLGLDINAGTNLIFGSYLGGSGTDTGRSITLGSNSQIYISGETNSADFPLGIAGTPYDSSINGSKDIFVSLVDGSLQGGAAKLLVSTFLGGSGTDYNNALTIDKASGTVFVVGSTNSTDFPANSYDTSANGNYDAYVTSLQANLSVLGFSTYIGGNGEDDAKAIFYSPGTALYIGGSTASSNFPVTSANAIQTGLNGTGDAFALKLSLSGTDLLYSTLLGGSADQEAVKAIYSNAAGHIYAAGSTNSTNFPTVAGGPQTTNKGTVDGFILKLSQNQQNDTWAYATPLNLTPTQPNTYEVSISESSIPAGGSRWYKITAGKDARILLNLAGSGGNTATLPGQLDLVLYKDLQVVYNGLLTPLNSDTLAEQTAKAAPYEFLPYEFLPYEFLPYEFLPYEFLPYEFLPYSYLPYEFLPGGGGNNLAALSAYFRTEAYLPSGYLAEPYASSVAQGIVAISAKTAESPENISYSTFSDSGDYYIRVINVGSTPVTNPFVLNGTVEANACSNVAPVPASVAAPPAPSGSYKTLLLTDFSRLPGTPEEKTALKATINTFKTRPEVQGTLIDLGQASYQRVKAAQAQADTFKYCPAAKNIVAQEIRAVIDAYRAGSTGLAYLVLIGPDNVIPFYRYLDRSGYGEEKGYNTPLVPEGPAYSALRSNLVLGQDGYGAQRSINTKGIEIPMPSLAVGRLVEKASDADKMLSSYIAANGQLFPTTGLVTGYDFVTDAANSIYNELSVGMGEVPASLINNTWTADDLRGQLLTSRKELVFMGGHFSAGSALAADNSTILSAHEIVASQINMANTVIFSVGCHSGYNISPEDTIPISEEPDWAQAFNRKGANAILGTGYQYGDTELVEYSERLYVNFTKQLRNRSLSPSVSLGTALLKAKQTYITDTPALNGMHQKVLLETTLYGLPMLQVTIANPNEITPETSTMTGLSAIGTAPGVNFGLLTTFYTLPTPTTQVTRTMTNMLDNSSYTGVYVQGTGGKVVANGVEPIFPLVQTNISVTNRTLRSVGFWGGSFTDQTNVFPLTSAPGTENGRGRVSFESPVFYPAQPWGMNLSATFAKGPPYLVANPAQYKSSAAGSLTGTLRTYSSMSFRVFYTNNNLSSTMSEAAPSIASVSSIPTGTNQVLVSVVLTGVKNASIHCVWLTYYFEGTNTWQSVDLNIDTNAPNRTVWKLLLPLGGQSYNNLRFMVQAVSGTGLLTIDTNNGQYYTPAPDTQQPVPTVSTALSFINLPASVSYGATPTIGISLTKIVNGVPQPLPNKKVEFTLAERTITAFTNANGQAFINSNPNKPNVVLNMLPGTYFYSVRFAGDDTYQKAFASRQITLNPRATNLNIIGQPTGPVSYGSDSGVVILLRDDLGRPLADKTLVVVGSATPTSYAASIRTDSQGRARLGVVNWPAGVYNLRAFFGQDTSVMSGAIENIYAPSQTNVTGPNLTITPRDGRITYTGATSLEASYPLVTAKFEDNNAISGNLGLVRLKYEVRNSLNQTLAVFTSTVEMDGNATAVLSGIGIGNYNLLISLDNNYFTALPVSVPISVNDCLQVTQNSDIAGGCGTLRGAIDYVNTFTKTTQILTITLAANVEITSPLPLINNVNGTPIVLDGGCTTDNTGRGVPGKRISSNGSGSISDGLRLGSNVTVNGLRVNGFSNGYAISLEGDNNTITCSILGRADQTDSLAASNRGGIRVGAVGASSNNNRIGLASAVKSGNLISGNNGPAILVVNGSGNSAAYNYIGVSSSGLAGLANSQGAIRVMPGGKLLLAPYNVVKN